MSPETRSESETPHVVSYFFKGLLGEDGRIEGKVLPEKAVEREPTALARPACMYGRGVK